MRWPEELYRIGYVIAAMLLAIAVSTWSFIAKWRSETWSAIFEGLTFFAVVGAAVIALRQIWHMRSETELQLILELSKRWNSPEMEEARRAANTYLKKSEELSKAMQDFLASNSPNYFILTRVPDLFEDLGVLWARDKHLHLPIREMLGDSVVHYWDIYEQYILKLQEKNETTYEHFRKLQKALKALR